MRRPWPKSARLNKLARLCFPVTLVLAIRVIGTASLYHLLSPDGVFHTPWSDANPGLIPSTEKWLWLFNAGDAPHFALLAALGYSHPYYVFLPGYPILIRFVSLLVGDYWFGAFLVAQAFALASIVVFQLLAEQYMHRDEALAATLLMATFPYISLFTTLSYSEAVFLFSTLSTWYFYKKGRIGVSSLLAGLASVTRIYGAAILLPVLSDIVKRKRYRELLYLAIPVAAMASWVFYCYLSTGDPLASWTDEQVFTKASDSKTGLVQSILFQLLRGVVGKTLDPAVLASVVLFAYLIARIWKVDRLLWVYAVSMFSLLLLFVTAHISLLRFLSFIFPIWLTVKVRNPVVVAVCIALFAPVMLLLWLYTMTVFFIG